MELSAWGDNILHYQASELITKQEEKKPYTYQQNRHEEIKYHAINFSPLRISFLCEM